MITLQNNHPVRTLKFHQFETHLITSNNDRLVRCVRLTTPGSTENIVMGESGNPLSPYFLDQFPSWYSGKTFAMPFTESAVTASTTHTLRLVP